MLTKNMHAVHSLLTIRDLLRSSRSSVPSNQGGAMRARGTGSWAYGRSRPKIRSLLRFRWKNVIDPHIVPVPEITSLSLFRTLTLLADCHPLMPYSKSLCGAIYKPDRDVSDRRGMESFYVQWYCSRYGLLTPDRRVAYGQRVTYMYAS